MLKKIVGLIIPCLLVQGCLKREPLENSNSAPFTVSGFTLGNSVSSSFKQDNPDFYCKSEQTNVLSCFKMMTDSNKGFFSMPLDSLRVEIDVVSQKILKITASIVLDGKSELSKYDIEQAWRLQGRCLAAYDYESAVRYDIEKTRYFDQIITEALLYPSGSDVVCMSDDGRFFKYDGKSGEERWATTYRLAEQYVTAFSYIFAAFKEYKAANGLS